MNTKDIGAVSAPTAGMHESSAAASRDVASGVTRAVPTVTLHIEHAVVDFDTWAAAFARFDAVRAKAGVRRHVVRQPADDPRAVAIDLDFDSVDRAEAFLGFLRTKIWSTPDNSPALVGTPVTQILRIRMHESST